MFLPEVLDYGQISAEENDFAAFGWIRTTSLTWLLLLKWLLADNARRARARHRMGEAAH
jgi:hypothetical protein